MFQCDQCDKSYQWKDSLVRHKKTVHGVASKRKSMDEQNVEDYPPLERSDGWKLNQSPGFVRDQPLERSNAVPDQNVVSKRNVFGYQSLEPRKHLFKFKHPFCMMVAGPSRSGKTQWVVQLLQQRGERIDPPVDGVVYCYAHWQDKYDDLQRTVPTIHFHQGPPSLEMISSLRNGILVLDDLMERVVKDTNLMSVFTEGSHHKNISVSHEKYVSKRERIHVP